MERLRDVVKEWVLGSGVAIYVVALIYMVFYLLHIPEAFVIDDDVMFISAIGAMMAIGVYCIVSVIILLTTSWVPEGSELYDWWYRILRRRREKRRLLTDPYYLIKLAWGKVQEAKWDRRKDPHIVQAHHPIAYTRALGVLCRKVGQHEIDRLKQYGFVFYRGAIFVESIDGGPYIITMHDNRIVRYCVIVNACVPPPEIILHHIFLWDQPQKFYAIANRHG